MSERPSTRTLVLGGIRSGKSLWAEAAIADAGERLRYIATGATTDSDPSWARRLAEHRDRRPQSWETVESAEIAHQLRHDPETPALVDDMGGWLTGVLDRRGWESESVIGEVEELLAAVQAFGGPLVLVSPEVGLSVVPATTAGRRFADELGTLNQRLAAECDQVVLVVAGQPVWVKR